MTDKPAHPNAQTLRLLYEDFSLLDKYAADDIVLHAANRRPGDTPVTGKQAVLAHEKALFDLTGGTLVMDVESIYANDSFGAVAATLRSSGPVPIAMPICGLWRFADGLVVEHWENAYDAAALTSALVPAGSPEETR